jgi:methionyl-tRNA synthetase
MASSAPCGKDGNYSDEDFKEKVNAHLANSMGNLLNRTLSMLVKYFGGDIKPEFLGQNELEKEAKETIKSVKHHFDYFEVSEAAQKIIELVDITNKYVTDNAPWTLAKEGNMEKCGIVLTNVLEVMCVVTELIYPFCPNISKAMSEQLGFDMHINLDSLTCTNLKAGHLIDKENIKPVFLRMDSEFADKTK